jgi:hypothetical protein
MTNPTPWTDYAPAPGKPDENWRTLNVWDAERFPYLVRWNVATGDRLTKWRTLLREFATLEEAVAAYKRPFRGLSVDLVAYNGGPPGKHLDPLARRKCTKRTTWSDKVPPELR